MGKVKPFKCCRVSGFIRVTLLCAFGGFLLCAICVFELCAFLHVSLNLLVNCSRFASSPFLFIDSSSSCFCLFVCLFVCEQDISKHGGRIRMKLDGQVECATRTSRFDFGSGRDADPVHQWDTKRKLFSLEKVSALPCAKTIYGIER